MQIDKRDDLRVDAQWLDAKISIFQSNRSILVSDVQLLDISHSGIKLRVKKPLIASAGAKVQLEAILPESGIPVIVNAVVVHSNFDSEFGLQYIDVQQDDPIDKLIAECKNIKSSA